MQKQRLDDAMIAQGLAGSREEAQKWVMAGQVRVDGQMLVSPAAYCAVGAQITVDLGPRYVSRGGEKLEAALVDFGFLALNGAVCADVGASTGGFSDCLLQHGASKVYALDVGYGELHWKLRNDPRVVVMERTNARYVESLPEPPALVSIDASFISLRVLLPVVRTWFGEAGGDVLTLIKPQFEARRAEVSRGGGVIEDGEIHRRVLLEVLTFAQNTGYDVRGLIRSPLKGPKGNTEFLAWLTFATAAPLATPPLMDLLHLALHAD